MMVDNVAQGFRPSPQQKRVWLLQQFDGSLAYRAQCALRLDGNLHAEVLKQALQEVVDRHEILRTTFHVPAGLKIPFQRIADRHTLDWRSLDLTDVPLPDQELKIAQLFKQDGLVPFDLQHGPLLRLSLLRLSGRNHVLLLSLSSLCADAASLNNLVQEISRCYATRIRGEEAADEVQSYVQFSEWQNELLEDPEGRAGKDYWRNQNLSSIPEATLPFERKPRDLTRFEPAALTSRLRPDVAAKITNVVEKYDTSESVFLLACWQVLLWRLTRQQDIVVGAVFDGRPFQELKNAIGLLGRPLPVRSHFDDNSKFGDVLLQLNAAIQSASEWQEYFTEEHAVGPATNCAGIAFFPTGFEFEQRVPRHVAAEVFFSIDRRYVCMERFKVKLCCVSADHALTAEFYYDRHLFSPNDIERLAGEYLVLVESAAGNPEALTIELEILTAANRRQLLIDFNDARADETANTCFHQLFEQQVDRTPDDVAVVCEGAQLTYAELNVRANQLAHHLRRLGIGPELPVALWVERSIEMVIALLAILKAGGAYVPLDPALPKERLAIILDESQTSLVLTQKKLVENLPARQVRVICMDTDRHLIARESQDNPGPVATAENLAYVIFTSGSTGRPKGVAVEHGQLLHYVNGILPKLDLPAGASFATVSTLAADLGNTAIFPALCSGGRLHVVTHERASDPDALGEYFRRHAIDCLKIVPSHLETLLFAAHPENVLPRKRLILGGEASSWALIEKVQALSPNCAVLNHYGPTETTIGATTYPVTKNSPDDRPTTPPIGRPIANAQTYVLDSRLQPVPIWVPGELHIGGDGLARGYLHRPELTAEKFIPNPFSDEPGARLYKTGDLARYLPDGNIEFLGRIDNQVKIRGFRVELGEIEAVLSQHPGVWKSAVIALDDGPGDRQLAAYIVAATRPPPTIGELRSFLQQKLPEYMIPSAVAYLELLPLSPNGKLDRKALPPLEKIRREATSTFALPTTPVEEKLARIWSEILKLERVGIYDNFFELGGHSLLAIQVISRVRQAFHADLPLRSLFEAPTVRGLAERIEKARGEEQGLPTPPLLPTSRSDATPLSFAQQRLWFLDQLEPGSTVYNVPGALRLRGSLDVAALEQSLHEIIRRHESLRTTFAMIEGEPVQVISPSLSAPLPVVDLTDHPESEREDEARRLSREEARRPFDLSRGPLLRVSLLRLSEQDHVLLLTMHHIVSDGWSMGVLFRELSVLYEAFSNEQPSPLPDLPIQYADFSVWQRNWLQGEVLESQLSYWKKQLEGAPAVLNLPTDRSRTAVQSHRGARQSIVVCEELTQSLKALSRKQGVTLFMTLLAAFQTLLHRYTGQDDIVVGSPIAGRNRQEIEGLIGFFVNTLVLRTDLSGNPTFRELLGRVREMALGAYAHQDLPFEKLVEELHPERSLNHTPLFQVLFNMFNQGDSKLDLFGLTAERLSSSNPESKFDLTLYVRAQNDEISFNLVYRFDLFSQARMTCFLQQYRHLLEQIASAPEKLIQSYSLVTPESRVLLPDPSTVLAEPPQQLVTNTFLSWAKQTPKHPAISQGEQTWTYDDLAERAETLARGLRASGLQQGDVVAVYGRRSFGLIASMIGTLSSGGVLLPLDYNLPGQRKQLMLREAKAKILLYVGDKRSDEEWLEGDFAPAILFVDAAKGCAVDVETGADLESMALPEFSPDDPAYIFFTSGTTGVPKGVLGCHKGLSHFLKWQRETFAIGPQDRSAQLTSLSFDVVLRDIFLPLTSGATLCLPEDGDALASDEIISWLERERITILHTVPTLAQSWMTNGAAGASLNSMRWVFFAGEPLTETVVRPWRVFFPNSGELVNLYGPTETTLAKCFYRVPAQIPPGIQPVGCPLPDTQALVLAEDNRLCGINEPGEIVLRTPFRSLGYINAPEENQKRFVKNPFRDDAEDLIYFTGDAGRYRPDGTLEILGRLDDQVKIRGVRIEPAEVTATLARHPLVESCVVVGKKNERDETYLATYAVASGEEKSTTTELRSYLLQQLPAAMVPTVFVFLDSLPLTPNGKVDRQALPEPDHKRSEPEESFVAPRTEIERIVAGIWTEVLKPERVGVHDNFFDLGGHSLLATQVVSRIRGALEVELPLRVLFEKPTVASLSDHIESVPWPGKKNSCISKDNLGETEEIIL